MTEAAPVVYRTPITPRDLARVVAAVAHVHVTVRRHPPHLTFVLVAKGHRTWPSSWPSYAARVYIEPPE